MIKIQSTVYPDREHGFNEIAVNAREQSNVLRFGKPLHEIKSLVTEAKIKADLKKQALIQFNLQYKKQNKQ